MELMVVTEETVTREAREPGDLTASLDLAEPLESPGWEGSILLE